MRLRYLPILLLAAYLLTGVAQVRPEERAVVRRFGQVIARPGPGLWVGLPWGIDRVDRVPVLTARQLNVGYDPEAWSDIPGTPAGQFLTGDHNLVNVQIVLHYANVSGPESDQELDDYVMHQDQITVVLDRVAEAAMGEWISGRPVDRVLLSASAELPAWVMDRAGERLPAFRLGVRLQRVSVAYIAPPEEVRAAFEAVTQAQTAIRTKELQARQDADQRDRQAEALRYRLAQQAAEYRESQLRQADADATEFRAQLGAYRDLAKSNPDALAFLWWDEMRKALTGLRARGGRVEPLDSYLGAGGLDVTQVITPRKR
jgi:membrane protease subunit HflK